jgi:hypothetical protein
MLGSLPPSSLHPPGHFIHQQWVALAITLVIFLLAVLAAVASGRGKGVLMGKDGRLSTSKTIAVLWTAVVAYCLLTLTFIAATGTSTTNLGIAFLRANVKELGGIYLALLGGPFAAFLFAKLAVPIKMAHGTLQKTDSVEGFNPADLFNDDSGNSDLVDLQYVIFNLVVMVYVLVLFVPHPAIAGLPKIPQQLAVLTGSAAATYILNKGLSKNEPSISALNPSVQRPGGLVVVEGANLWIPETDAGGKPIKSTITLGNIPGAGQVAATVVPLADSSAVKFQVPVLPGPFPMTPVDVLVTTNAGRLVTAPPTVKLTIVADVPRIDQISPDPASRGAKMTLTGGYLAGPPILDADGAEIVGAVPAQPEVLVDGVSVPLTGNATEMGLAFEFPATWNLPPAPGQVAQVVVQRAGAASTARPIPVKP